MKRALLALAAVIVAIAGGGVALALLTGGDAPPPPKLSGAERGVLTVQEGGTPLKVAARSFVGYRVDEEYLGVGVNTAVGRTAAVTGTLDVFAGRIDRATLEADLTLLRSDEARRDSALTERGIETNRYPKATFELGGAFAVKPAKQRVSGTLSLHGRSAPITVTVEGESRRDGGVELVGSAKIRFADFGIEPPSVAGLVTVKSSGLLEFRVVATPG